MIWIVIEIKVLHSEQVIVHLKTIEGKLKNPRALYARWIVQGEKWIDDNFKKQGGLLQEGTWKDIKPATKKARRKGKKKGGKSGDKILMDTGDLKGSFSGKHVSGGDGIKLGTAKTYAIYHESDKPRKKLPQRRMLPRKKDVSFMNKINKTTHNYIKEIING